MPDIIRLLPDSIANQIAAGEVIQRPASVIKELLDNAVDAQATEINVIIKDAGKTVIHIQDNGSGMSPTDARMSLERHATSKLRKAEDLFDIRTMGFRGEALASIAAIAHLEIKTRRAEDQIGTRILVEASVVTVQEGCQCPVGTSVIVRNLFYNVPARRKFLKSDPVEMRHILDEFHHLALAFEQIQFKLYHHEQEIYNLPAGSLRNRIINIFGKKINEHLVPVEEETNYVNFSGYIGKPKLGKKSRGEQFLFVNRRFIRSSYLQHAVKSAYEDILPPDQYPFYILFLDINADKIDINVHPTKQEIKFEDERIIYNYLRAACRHALGKYSITPSIDFEQEVGINRSTGDAPARTVFNSGMSGMERDRHQEKENIKKWGTLLQSIEGFSIEKSEDPADTAHTPASVFSTDTNDTDLTDLAVPVQLWQRYIVVTGLANMLVIDQRAAHERILFESMMKDLALHNVATQKLLWPETIQSSTADAAVLRELVPHLQSLGFDVAEFGHDTFIIHGIPAIMTDLISPQQAIEDILDRFKEGHQMMEMKPVEKIAFVMASNLSRRRGEIMTTEEMQSLIEQLMASDNPYTSPSGRKTFITFGKEEILKRFQS
ncbi:MAG: DNA mismatch repair endonuclease MutL [Saprospiraceae bacterium]|nr:DNA mismatch repair endonuclease MutL [Saprospiraceae bacterium]